MTVLVVVEAAAILLLGLLVVGLLRSHVEILRQLHELGGGQADLGLPASAQAQTQVPASAVDLTVGGATGTEAHDLAGQTPAGEAAAIGVIGTTHDSLLAFLSSGCLTCGGFWEALGHRGDLGLPAGTRVIAVTKSPDDESQSAVRKLAPTGRTVVMSNGAWADYQVPGSPYFVHVSGPAGRVIGEGTASTWEQVVSLVGRATEDRLANGANANAANSADSANSANSPASNGADATARIDAELMAAGVGPGDPTLYPTSMPVPGEEQ